MVRELSVQIWHTFKIPIMGPTRPFPTFQIPRTLLAQTCHTYKALMVALSQICHILKALRMGLTQTWDMRKTLMVQMHHTLTIDLIYHVTIRIPKLIFIVKPIHPLKRLSRKAIYTLRLGLTLKAVHTCNIELIAKAILHPLAK